LGEDIKIGLSTINAMAETIDKKPVFREAFQRRRCLVPADSFYESQKTGKETPPYATALVIGPSWPWPGYGRRDAPVSEDELR
jgi:putative SOS response-associated peptidase YedK